MQISHPLSNTNFEKPLWQGNNTWLPWQPTNQSHDAHLYLGQNSWDPWGGIDSIADMDEYRADKAVDIKATLIVITALAAMLLHYSLSN